MIRSQADMLCDHLETNAVKIRRFEKALKGGFTAMVLSMVVFLVTFMAIFSGHWFAAFAALCVSSFCCLAFSLACCVHAWYELRDTVREREGLLGRLYFLSSEKFRQAVGFSRNA